MNFKLEADFQPAGDQPPAIAKLTKGLKKNYREQTLLGVTGSGKTFTMAKVIETARRPTLVISHNKTLAAQLYGEFRDFFPTNAVHYFVSYYDYYQPEAYIPQTDTYIEKEAQINEEIDRLRHAATQALLTRRDCVIVASVSCIYGLGEKDYYENQSLTFNVGQVIRRQEIARQLVRIQYDRDDLGFYRGSWRLTGGQLDIHLASGEQIIRLLIGPDRLEAIQSFAIEPGQTSSNKKKPQTAAWLLSLKSSRGRNLDSVTILPAKHFITPEAKLQTALTEIEKELDRQTAFFKKEGKLAEADRLTRRTNYDLEMFRTVGYVNGIENYSRHLSGRAAGEPPDTLLDFFPEDFLTFIDESHVTLPQIRGMSSGDRSRKQTLVDFGWRLPSARDNRPLTFAEFRQRVGQVVYVSATPDTYELTHSQQVVEQIIRPTGLLDPAVEVRPSDRQISDLLLEIDRRVKKHERVLALTLTKRMAEELSEFLAEKKIKVAYLHSEIETLERVNILRDLQSGRYDVLVGINLLREGLDLPEVSLVAILNADMAGFLRTATSLIQTMGRAARHERGQVIMYANRITPAMNAAIRETSRRRRIQEHFNQEHGLTPRSIVSSPKKFKNLRISGDATSDDNRWQNDAPRRGRV